MGEDFKRQNKEISAGCGIALLLTIIAVVALIGLAHILKLLGWG